MTQDGLGFGANGSINLHDFLAYVRCLHCLAMNFSLDSSSGAAKYDNPFKFVCCLETYLKQDLVFSVKLNLAFSPYFFGHIPYSLGLNP